MLADMLTKGITHEKFIRLLNRCGAKYMSACKREGVLESPLLSDELIHSCMQFIVSLLFFHHNYFHIVLTLLLHSYTCYLTYGFLETYF